ncbi:hypothetical protein WJX73_010651 [Symbiochloris irregularis]|uniref:Uncharacterized protein n=1 Tax=Symbiochloris irregularis TaxID=706552 RepID=A0AAW1NUN6_9CHLO
MGDLVYEGGASPTLFHLGAPSSKLSGVPPPGHDRDARSNVANSFEAAGWSFDEPVSHSTPPPGSQAGPGSADEFVHPSPNLLEGDGSLQRRSSRILSERAAAAAWVQQLTGATLPHDTDGVFRAALRDGVLFCRLLKILRPHFDIPITQQVGSTTAGSQIQSLENVTRFLEGLAFFQFPAAAKFEISDLEAPATDERPQVTRCIMTLKRCHDAERAMLMTPQATASHPLVPASPTRPSPRPSGSIPTGVPVDGRMENTALPPASPWRESTPHPMGASPGLAQGHVPLNPDATPEMDYQRLLRQHFGSNSKAGAFPRESLQAANQVTRVVQQVANDLGDRLVPAKAAAPAMPRYGSAPAPVTSPDKGASMESISPILENVLSSLTGEYEKKLFDKDQEVKALQGKVLSQQQDLQAAAQERQMLELRAPMMSQQRQSSAGEALELQRLQERERELQGEVRNVRRLMERAQDEAAQMRAAYADMQAQVEDVQLALTSHQEVVEENKRLYNQVLDLKGNIRVFCRVRPPGTTGDPAPSCMELGVDGEVAAYNPRDGKRRLFKFDRVFGPEASQTGVYEDTSALIRSVLDGFNVCIFAYGQTGSGKTHTMSGTHMDNVDDRGINFRALNDLFELNHKRQSEVVYTVRVQLLEIYNEQLRDLLEDNRNAPRLEIRMTERSGVNVPNARQVEVETTEDVLAVMAQGMRNRAVAETRMNERSSRSHSVLTVIVDGEAVATGERTHGCLHLIDLAGSERVGKSEASGDRLEEAKHINKSLSALGDVMAALAAKDRGHVPYRNSKLTQLLQDSLCGQAKAMMFVHISPEESSHGESISTLQFGARVKEISLGAAKKNVESGAIFEAREQARTADSLVAAEASKRRFAESQLEEAMSQLEMERRNTERLQAEVEALRCDINLPSPASSSRDPSETIAAVYPPSSALHQSLRAQMGAPKYSPAFRERPGSAATVASGAMQTPGSPRISASPRGYSSQLKSHRLTAAALASPSLQGTPSPLAHRRASFPLPKSSTPSGPDLGATHTPGSTGARSFKRSDSDTAAASGSLTSRSHVGSERSHSNIPRMPNSARGPLGSSSAANLRSKSGIAGSNSSMLASLRSSQSSSIATRRTSLVRASFDGRTPFSSVPDTRSSKQWK